MKPDLGNLVVTITVKDEFTPKLRRITREMWVMQHSTLAMSLAFAALFLLGLVVGFLVGMQFR